MNTNWICSDIHLGSCPNTTLYSRNSFLLKVFLFYKTSYALAPASDSSGKPVKGWIVWVRGLVANSAVSLRLARQAANYFT
jgi:hypothetical protein